MTGAELWDWLTGFQVCAEEQVIRKGWQVLQSAVPSAKSLTTGTPFRLTSDGQEVSYTSPVAVTSGKGKGGRESTQSDQSLHFTPSPPAPTSSEKTSEGTLNSAFLLCSIKAAFTGEKGRIGAGVKVGDTGSSLQQVCPVFL